MKKRLSSAMRASTLLLSIAAASGAFAAPEAMEISCPGATINTLIDGHGPTIVLIPSAARDSLDMDVTAAALAQGGYQVLRPQPRGTAGSSPNRPDETLNTYAYDVACVLDRVGNAPAVVVGHAFGNWIARVFAVRYPSKTRGVVLAAAAASEYPVSLRDDLERIVAPDTPESERRRLIAATFFAARSDASVWWSGWYPEVDSAQSLAASTPPRDQWWGAGDAPLLEIHALEDPWMPAERRGDMRRDHGARVTTRTVADASHALFPEQPQQVSGHILDWVKTLPASSAMEDTTD